MTNGPYNPLDKYNLAQNIAQAILATTPRQLAQSGDLHGAGVYAIYYTGNFPAYSRISEANLRDFSKPIYVGKAIPKGGRKGGLKVSTATRSPLQNRVRKHAASIKLVANLDLSDFWFRSLVIDDIWIPLGENMLIEQFKPIWNLVIDGFGINAPGEGRANQRKSRWDILHPGRNFAAMLPEGGRTPQSVLDELARYFLMGQVPPMEPDIEDESE